MSVAMKLYQRFSTLAAPAEEVFAWHARPGALERLTPPWLRLRVLERGRGLEPGSRVVLRVGPDPAAVRWVALHRDVRPGRGFTDEQVEGPFRRWVHDHRLEPANADACRLTDRVEYELPLGRLGALLDRTVRVHLDRLFNYRHAVLRDDLAAHARWREHPRLHVAVTGAGGLIGTALRHFLTSGGHRVTRLVRRAPGGADEISWDPARGELDAAALDGADAVVHLAGENIAGARWSEEHKRRVKESRERGTRFLAERLARLPRPPRVLVSASGVGYYGHRGEEVLTEESPAGRGFLPEVGEAWERATAPAAAAGIRVVRLRFGIVLTPAGGALAKMLLPFRLGLGGRLGSGRQWMGWLSLDDAVGAIHHALLSETLAGPVNAVAPEPIRNRDFAKILGRVLDRPALALVPAAALRLAFGEMADEALLASARVRPDRLLEAAYPFRHPTLEAALRHVLGR